MDFRQLFEFKQMMGKRYKLLSDLVCPLCHSSMVHEGISLSCPPCGKTYPVFEGEVPVFIETDANMFSSRLFGLEPESLPNEDQIQKLPPEQHAQVGLLLWSLAWDKITSHTVAIGEYETDPDVERAFQSAVDSIDYIFGGSLNYDAIYLKAVQSYHFAAHPPVSPSLEFGGNWGWWTNYVYPGLRIEYSSEFIGNYFLDGFKGSLHTRRHEVFDQLLVSYASKLPLPDSSLKTVLSMHILDHVPSTELEDLFREGARVLAKGGRFIADTYTPSGIHRSLADVLFLDKLGFSSKDYSGWRNSYKNATNATAYVQKMSASLDGYANGQNLLTLEEWEEIGERFGLRLIKKQPYNLAWIHGLLKDIYYKGFFPPKILDRHFLGELKKCVYLELKGTKRIEFSDACNVFMIFEKI